MITSLRESLFANNLLRQGIEYLYEVIFEQSIADVFYRQYQPDFYLPVYAVYIEFYGIDRRGNTEPYLAFHIHHGSIEEGVTSKVSHQTD